MRTVREPCEVSGTGLKPGDHLLLSYTSANRDEDVFEDPFRFDITRNPNRHLAFGTGPHVCLGARLARMELTAFFGALVPRLRTAELDGQPQLVHTVFGGGLKPPPRPIRDNRVAGRWRGGPADSLTISSTGSTSVRAGVSVPVSRSKSSSTPTWARRSSGDLIVVSRGRTYWLNLVSSKPTTARSPGTLTPWVSAAESIPSAM